MPDHLPIENINRQEFAADELLLGFGTTYVTRKTLNRAPLGFLNLHTGVLPDYRGVKSEFWCLKARDYANLGWTLHFMTPKLDEGDIVQIGRVPFENEDPAALRVKLIRDALPALVGWLRQVKTVGMSALPRVPQIGGAYYTTPTLREWRRYRTHRPGDTGNA
jgi:methionyl-tRNA formyltransferase